VSLSIAILAGGEAKRLRPLTTMIPKALVDIAGKPFILRQIDGLRRQGISRIVLCLGHLGEQVKEVVGDGSALGVHLDYSWDGPRLLGTGGAIKKALPLLGEQFMITYGDTFLPIDFSAVERAFFRHGMPGLITVLRNRGAWDTSNAALRDGLVDYNKRDPAQHMEYIDYGLAVVSAQAFNAWPGDTLFDLSDVYEDLSRRRLLAGIEVFERFYEIGSPDGLGETIAYFVANDAKQSPAGS
jgi:MurNAc alpha-1-phosphate uridylyltransferase